VFILSQVTDILFGIVIVVTLVLHFKWRNVSLNFFLLTGTISEV